MQHSKQTGSNLKRKITATLLSLAIVGTSAAPLVSTVVANAASAEEDSVVGARLPHSEKKGIFWANATYFDYYSDNERNTNTWRNNIQAGTGFNGSEDNWFPFYQFNQKISTIAGSNSAWSKPLYLGNMLPREIPGKTGDEALPYKKSDHNGPIDKATQQAPNKLTRYDAHANNSNTIYCNGAPVYAALKLSPYDRVRFGHTELLFVPFCCERFTWPAAEPGDVT